MSTFWTRILVLYLNIKFLEFKEINDKNCNYFQIDTNVNLVAQFSNNFLAEEDEKVLKEWSDLQVRNDVYDKYYKMVSKPLQSHCNVLKSFGGHWTLDYEFLDGAKMVCMDGLYKAVRSGTCLVYSFGLADDWDFEMLMASLGKYIK